MHLETFPLVAWVRGAESAEIVSAVRQRLVVAALGESPATPAGGLDGEVLMFPSFTDLLLAPPGSLAGKIAFEIARMVRTQDGSGYRDAVELLDADDARISRSLTHLGRLRRRCALSARCRCPRS